MNSLHIDSKVNYRTESLLLSRDGGNSSKRIFLKNIDFLVKMFFKDNSSQKNLYEDAASKEIFTLYTREEYNLGRIILKDFFKPV